ncbi:hypothetical protein DM02DRAFT_657539 [Periconia macrospinosa]|uniref:Uncharacterized protein n=1 Tax=Periconia macrospinosa TaxID=97972 RepID=A0A2V1DJ46_9PLEO|nr:hypothetical protein DM02DRAFT_657539 [Periconia macrospinosa]
MSKTNDSTSYGDIKYRAFNMTRAAPVPLPSMSFVKFWETMSASSNSQWNHSFITSNPPPAKIKAQTLLGDYQGKGLNFYLPGAVNPGLGPAFLPRNDSDYAGTNTTIPLSNKSISLDQFAYRFLFAEGEAQRILYEVSASDTSTSKNPPEFFVDVHSIATTLRYRITIVPSLLLLGLLALIFAGIITVTLMAYT